MDKDGILTHVLLVLCIYLFISFLSVYIKTAKDAGKAGISPLVDSLMI